MNRRELTISNKRLHSNTKEDIILKAPFRIPPKDLYDIISLKGIISSDTAYYDISPTEIQNITYNQEIKDLVFDNSSELPIELYDILNIKMGDII